jgi:kynurenine formamidase
MSTQPDANEVRKYFQDNNWGRWGKDDQKGAINLVTPDKSISGIRAAQHGRVISLSRPYPKTPGPGNPNPAQHFMGIEPKGSGGAYAWDYYGISYHNLETTHVDALCHVWDENGMWNGREPQEYILSSGAQWGDINQWGDGIVTRGVLLDVPRFRGVPYVTHDEPVHGSELRAIAEAQGVDIQSGDALVVYSGRERWSEEFGPLGATTNRPGLHVSCMPFIKEVDAAVLVWDQMDLLPNDYGLPWSMHGVIFSYGLALVDNARLDVLADNCDELGKREFLFVLAPLRVEGGTGSPANPLVVL